MYAERESRKAAAKRRLVSSSSSGNFNDIALKGYSMSIEREYTTNISPWNLTKTSASLSLRGSLSAQGGEQRRSKCRQRR
jgi:hypothetical protein